MIKKVLLSLFIFLCVASLSYMAYYMLAFFVTKSIPKHNALVTDDIRDIEIDFNKEISENMDSIKNKLIIQPKLDYANIEIGRKKISLKSPRLESNTSYTISLINIKSKSDQTINRKVIKFKTGELPLVESNEEEFPLQFQLPHANERYSIDAKQIGNKVTYTITVYAILNRPSQQESYRQQLHEYSKEGYDWLIANGVDPKKYDIVYDPPNAPTY